MNTILLISGVLAFAANSITIRAFQLKCQKKKRDTGLFQAVFCLIASLAYMISGDFNFDLNLIETFSAMMFGLFFACAVLFSAACYTCGPMSVTSVIVNSSVIIPILYSCISLKEAVTLPQFIGCLLLIVTFIISAFNSNSGNKSRINLKWLIFVFIAFLSNGITAVIQKLYKISAPQSDGNIFMGVAYLTAAMVLTASFLAQKDKTEMNKSNKVKALPLSAILVLVAGLGSFIGNGILMKLSTLVPAAMLYPFINGGICVTVSIVSLILFKEKLNFKKALTIVIGLSAVIILNL